MNISEVFYNTEMFMYKGIECFFSEKSIKLVPTEDDKIHMLDFFFEIAPIDSITWVEIDAILGKKKFDGAPIYSMKHENGETILLWPILNKSDLILSINLLSEKPGLEQEIDLTGKRLS